ncbi:MAG: rhodanese-related sulfurtransferase [Crocinitomicaceae bacterium]
MEIHHLLGKLRFINNTIMQKFLFLLTTILFFTSCNTEAQTGNDGAINKVVTVDEFKKLLEQDNIQIIDVRTPEEYSIGKIGDATNINIYDDNFKAKLKELDPSKTTLVYCAKGGRSANAAKVMAELKFEEVYDLKGGYSAWSK